MKEVSAAYALAQHIHDTFWLRNGLVTAEEVAASQAYPKVSHISGNEQVGAYSYLDHSEPCYETLSKTKNGNFLFYAVPGYVYTGDLSLNRHVITPASEPELAYRLASSLLVRNLVRIANSRTLNERHMVNPVITQ